MEMTVEIQITMTDFLGIYRYRTSFGSPKRERGRARWAQSSRPERIEVVLLILSMGAARTWCLMRTFCFLDCTSFHSLRQKSFIVLEKSLHC